MENKISLIGIIVEDMTSTSKINTLLSSYSDYIIGRMGVPYKDRDVCIISVVLDAPPNVISTLSGKLGMISGVTSKTITSKV